MTIMQIYNLDMKPKQVKLSQETKQNQKQWELIEGKQNFNIKSRCKSLEILIFFS